MKKGGKDKAGSNKDNTSTGVNVNKSQGKINNPYNSTGGNPVTNSTNNQVKKDKSNANKNNNQNNIPKEKSPENVVVVQPPNENDEFLLENLDDDENNQINNKNVPNDNSEMNKKLAKKEELEKVKLRKTQANTFERYVNDTGISSAFQLIFSELITKKIPIEDHYSYAAGRLRQIGRDVEEIKSKNK